MQWNENATMRILTLSNCPLNESQGSGYVIVNFAQGLRARGWCVKLVDPQESIVMPRVTKARALRLAFGMWRRARELCTQFQPDIVEFYGAEAWLATDRLSTMPARSFKIVAHSNGIEPFVDEVLGAHSVHNTGDGSPPKWYQGRIRFPVEKAFSKADAIVTVSKPEADYALRRRFQPSDRVLAIDNALPETFLDQPIHLERDKTIGYCGSWLARKGAKLLVGDMTEVLRQAPDWKLHLVGVGNDFRTTDHFPADVASRVQVTGFVADKAEQRRIYQSWAIAVMPSIYESFGLVAAEAMACGCALVANRTGFAATLSDGEDALLLRQPISPELKDAVLRLIRDEPLRRCIAESGWKRVQSLRWEENVSKLESFYFQLVNQAREARAELARR